MAGSHIVGLIGLSMTDVDIGYFGLKNNNELRFYDNGNYVGFEAPSLSADQIWVLPTADGSANQVLETDGSGTLSWAASAGAAHAMLDGSTHNDSAADTVTRGSIIYGNATPAWDELVVGGADTFLGSDGTDVSYRTAAQVLASLSSEAAAAFAWNSQNLTGIGTVGCGEITVVDGSSINLQEALTFTGATTENLVEFPASLAVALAFKEGANSYLTFVSSTGSEIVAFGKSITIPDAGYIGTVSDTDALQIEADGDIVMSQDLAITGTLDITGTVTIPAALTGVIRADSGVLSVDADVTDIVTAATLTAQGKIEIATAAETNTGTDATRAVSPDGLEDWAGSAQITTVGTLSAGDVTAQVSAASTAAAGKSELATIAETNTGTDAGRAVTPDGLAGSVHGTKVVVLKCVDDATAPTVTDTSGHVTIPIELNGMDLVSVGAHVYTPSSGSGPVALHIYNLTQTANMLLTGMTIDDTENDTITAGTPAVIDGNNDDVATGDVLQIHVTDIGDAATRGLEIRMGFRLP